MGGLISPNGRGPEKAKPQEIEIDGRKYTVEANQRSASVSGFVGAVASQLLSEYLKGNGGELPLDPEEQDELFDDLFEQAERWRLALKRFERAKLEEYEKQVRGSTSLHLPDAGMIQDHLPPGAIPHMGS